MLSLKRCSTHKGYSPKSEFAKDPARKDGYSYVCKSCRSKVSKKYNDNWRNKTPVTFKHGMTGTYEHEAWMSMTSRHGAVDVCDEWKDSFMNFYLWVGPKPSSTHTLNRQDIEKRFEPGNVYWRPLGPTPKELKENKFVRVRKMGLLTAREAAEETGVSEGVILAMIRDKDISGKKILNRWCVKESILGSLKKIAVARKTRKGNPSHVSSDPNKLWCSKCKDYINKSDFYKDKNHWTLYSYVCKYCDNAMSKGYIRRHREKLGMRYTAHRHGRSGTPEYTSWAGAKHRVTNPNIKCWAYYGGRGITMCQEWQDDFMAFYNYIGPRPSLTHSLDRIDPNGNYEPGNVRWASRSEQANNKNPYKKNPRVHNRILAHKKPILIFIEEFRNLHTGPYE